MYNIQNHSFRKAIRDGMEKMAYHISAVSHYQRGGGNKEKVNVGEADTQMDATWLTLHR